MNRKKISKSTSKLIFAAAASLAMILMAETQTHAQWSLKGNSGTDPKYDFIGTKDKEDFVIRTNNKKRITISDNGKVGIGTISPKYDLHIYNDSSARVAIISNGGAGASLIIEKEDFSRDAYVSYRTKGTGMWQAGTLASNDFSIRNLPLAKIAFSIDRYTNNVAIGTANASNDAILEVASKTKGVLLARMSEVNRLAINNPTEGLTVFQTNGKAGYYYFHNNAWVAMQSDFEGWSVNGNAGLYSTTAFIGTTDVVPLNFKVNNKVAGIITANGNNTSFGLSALEVVSGVGGNTAIGSSALKVNSGGHVNTATGSFALIANTTGSGNSAFGNNALATNLTGENNSCFGRNADVTAQVNNATAIGFNAKAGATNSIRIGNNSIVSISGKVAFTQSSDARIKNNVQENVPGLEFVNALRPVTYHFDVNKENELLGNTDNEDFAGKYDIEKVQYTGFLAQEVEAAAQKIGYDFSGVDKTQNVMGLRYSEFVVPMVKAIQQVDQNGVDLKNRVQSLEEENSSLRNELNDIKQCLETLCNNSTTNKQTTIVSTSNRLEQNQPNPFNSNTVINYFINEKNATASIVVRDLNGHIVKELSLNNNGAGSISISANSLTEGTYTYSLFVNDKCVDTKLMVLTK